MGMWRMKKRRAGIKLLALLAFALLFVLLPFLLAGWLGR